MINRIFFPFRKKLYPQISQMSQIIKKPSAKGINALLGVSMCSVEG
jgi:hypothetical protein